MTEERAIKRLCETKVQGRNTSGRPKRTWIEGIKKKQGREASSGNNKGVTR